MTGNDQLYSGLRQGLQNNSVSAAVLSDDAHLCALIQQAMAMSQIPLFSLNCVSSQQYISQSLETADIIFIDTGFTGGQFVEVVQSEKNSSPNCRIVLVLEDLEIIQLASALATYVRQGIDQFILKADISLRQLQAAMSMHLPPGSVYPPELHSTAQPLARSSLQPQVSPPTLHASNSTASSQPQELRSQDMAFSHSMAIDLENSRLHIDGVSGSPLCNDEDILLSLENWFEMLHEGSALEFRTLLKNAQNYQPIPRTLTLLISNKQGQPITSLLEGIQLKNNGQGRVIGASARLHVEALDETAATSDKASHHSGFDNLPDSSELISQNSVWQNVTRSLPMLCLLLDEQGAIVRVLNEGNPGSQLSSNLAPGIKLAEVLDIESLDGLGETIARTLNTGKPHHQTVAYPDNTGLRWLDTHINKLKGDSGLSRQVVWTAFDITSNRRDYQELLKGHDSIVKILEDAPILFFQKDSAGRYLRVNKAFCDTFNLHADSISGRNDQDVFKDMETRFVEVSQQALSLADSQEATELNYQEELFGNRYQFQWHTIVQKRQTDNQVDFLCGFGIYNPATSSLDEIETASNVSTLQPAPSLAMSGALKQDFKTILNSLVNYAELALSQKNQKRAANIADHLSQVESTARHTRELVLEKSGENTEPESGGIQLKPIIEDTVKMLRPTLPASVSFETLYEAATEKALVDEASIKKILMLLLLNAKSTAESAVAQETDDQTIRLIHDTITIEQDNCAACEGSLEGSYISLTVQTAAHLDDTALNKLVNAAKQSTRTNSDDNVIALTHRVDGHVIIRHANDTLSLQLLFNKA